jgi:hypothetical protein
MGDPDSTQLWVASSVGGSGERWDALSSTEGTVSHNLSDKPRNPTDKPCTDALPRETGGLRCRRH